jgi:uncharacterized protein (DUF169 family)
MEDVKKFEKKLGGAWVRVKFFKQMPSTENMQLLKDVRFCEALVRVKTTSVMVTPSSISCPGANFAFNWNEQSNQKIIDECKNKINVSEDFLKSLIGNIPKLDTYFPAIGLNTDDNPDVLISNLQPVQVMRLIKLYQNQTGENIYIDQLSLMSVCGNIAVRCFLTQQISISFGCDDSRLYGNIERDRLVVGVPYALIKTFL